MNRTWLLALVALAGPIGTLEAQYPRARRGQFEVPGFDFRSDGAWRARTHQIRLQRRQWLGAGAVSALNASSPAARVAGPFNVPVLLVTFNNVSAPFPASAYEDVLFNPAPTLRPYSVKTYYEQLSNGLIQVNGVVRNWVIADSTNTYYEDGCNGIGVLNPCPNGGQPFGDLLLEVLQANDDGVFDWGQFDNDGPDGTPNSGDDDGVVDFVTFVHSDVDGACPASPHIWAHRFVIRAWNGGSPYVTASPWAGHPGQFIKVDDYTIQSGKGGASACSGSEVMPIGTVAHETGHAFGIPDLYDTNPNANLATEGIGEWGLMGSGNYTTPNSPARFDAWSAAEMGWVTVDTLSSSRTVTLGPVQTSDTVLYVAVPGTDEYFLLENRQALESDTAQMRPGYSRQKAPGLLIWHIDQGRINAGTFGNSVNRDPIHGVALVQADNLNQLRTPGGGNRGDTGDSYPGSTVNRRASALSGPALLDNQGAFAGFAIDSIFPVNPVGPGPVAFRFLKQDRSVVRPSVVGPQVKVSGAPYAIYSDIIAPGDTIALSVDSVQALANGKSRYVFTAWSDGQPATHTVTAGTTPDTLVATFAVEHRAKVTVSGGGTIQASVAGDPVAGIYTAAGTPITLTAVAPAGLIFGGWSGDTTSTNPSLTLPMNRGYDVVATFTAPVTVTLNQAVDALVGSGTLTTPQRNYLDQIGNQNGRYDVGDFLGYLELTGQAAPPEVMQHVLRKGK